MRARLCIIGCGYSAATLTMHLLARGLPGDRLAVIGPGTLGQGQAYGCVADDFRLNVRAELMRPQPDRPDHFAVWSAKQITDDPDAATTVGHFYRRRDFAAYMSHLLESQAGMSDIHHIQDIAEWITSAEDRWRVGLAGGGRLDAAKIIIATGNPEPEWPVTPPPEDAPGLIRTPWRGDWADGVDTNASVTIIGGGLTALDAIHLLHRRGHDGAITLVCPEGMLPPVQTGWRDATPLSWPQQLRGSTFLRFMRETVVDRDWSQTEWQRRFESLRVHISAAWQTMPASDKARLMRRLGWLWSLARFRAGPQASDSAHALIAAGQLTIIRDLVAGITPASGPRHRITLRSGTAIMSDTVINCSGTGRDRLLTRIITDGLVARHETVPHRPDMTSDLSLVGPDGAPHDHLLAVGPVTSHIVGDIVGAASISRQAATLATRLMADA